MTTRQTRKKPGHKTGRPLPSVSEEARQLSLALETAGLGIFEVTVPAGTVVADDRSAALLGLPAPGGYGLGEVRRLLPSQRYRILRAAAVRALAEKVRHLPPLETTLPSCGNRPPVQVRFRHLGGQRLLGTVVEVNPLADEHAEREKELRFLLAELDHRVKNTLASIQSVAMQTAFGRRSVEEFVDVFQGRLQAMANAHNLLSTSGWDGAVLAALAEMTLRPYMHGGVRFGGDPVVLDGKAAVTLGIVLHELATNAAKYGALSVPQARLELEWRVVGEAGKRLLVVEWRESRGPRVRPPARRGFGSLVIEKSLRHDLGGEADVAYREEGLRCVLRIPERHFRVERGDEGLREAGMSNDSAKARESETRVLVVEDMMVIAADIEAVIRSLGWQVAGPASTLRDGMKMATAATIDCAVLDISLGDEKVYPLADLLAQRDIPFLFLTGHDAGEVLPARFRGRPTLAKPYEHGGLKGALRRLAQETASPANDVLQAS